MLLLRAARPPREVVDAQRRGIRLTLYINTVKLSPAISSYRGQKMFVELIYDKQFAGLPGAREAILNELTKRMQRIFPEAEVR